jgi:hypothetical protein
MSLEKVVEQLGERADRTRFLTRVGAVVLGGTASFLGINVSDARAVTYICCNLCKWPTDPATCGYTCAWCWICCHASNGFKYLCCEGHQVNGTCCSNGDSCCSDVLCSWVVGQGHCY